MDRSGSTPRLLIAVVAAAVGGMTTVASAGKTAISEAAGTVATATATTIAGVGLEDRLASHLIAIISSSRVG